MKNVCLLLFSLLTVLAFADPVVSNIRASQRENTKLVDILYDVSYAGGSNVSVTCEVSTNSGASYDIPAESFSGTGYGAMVTVGSNRLITWNAGVDWNEKYSDQMKVRITAKAPRFTIETATYYDGNSNLCYSAAGRVFDNKTGLKCQSQPGRLSCFASEQVYTNLLTYSLPSSTSIPKHFTNQLDISYRTELYKKKDQDHTTAVHTCTNTPSHLADQLDVDHRTEMYEKKGQDHKTAVRNARYDFIWVNRRFPE